jgi:hypothetical protein
MTRASQVEAVQHNSEMNYSFIISCRILRLLGMVNRTTVEELTV